MCKGEVHGISGDIPNWVEYFSKNSRSESYFLKVWSKFIPELFTESDRPQCTMCAEIDIARKDCLKHNDGVGASNLLSKKKEHLRKAR